MQSARALRLASVDPNRDGADGDNDSDRYNDERRKQIRLQLVDAQNTSTQST
jgi:hypothetical protein